MRKLNKKGFTLIELLAVIIILGLLMAIAIPSVTRYIDQSRKNTLVTTMGNYISAAVTGMNNGDYEFYTTQTGGTKVENIYNPGAAYLVPLTCVDLEKGGTNPYGAWNTYSYVIIRYVSGDGGYKYGFQFRVNDNNWMNPTQSTKIDKDAINSGTANAGLSATPTVANLATTNWDGAAVPTSRVFAQCN